MAWTLSGSGAAIRQDYPRAADMPGAGFAAGPCLLKDTMQLAAFNQNKFVLGHSAMLINEGLPLYVVSRLEELFDLGSMTVGVLGMAFKAGSDDPRESLSYKLRKILLIKADETLCTDPYIKDERFSRSMKSWSGRICWSSGRRIRSTGTWPPTSRWRTCGGSPGGGPGYERRPVMKPGVTVVIPV